MTASEFQPYLKKSLPALKKLAQKLCNKYVRQRDEGLKCISCSSYKTTDASHFYSRGSYPAVALEEINVNKSCEKCNRFQGGNIHEYRIGLVAKYGEEAVKKLDNLVAYWKRNQWKPDKFYYIDKIIYFKAKFKRI